jgi:phage-related protein
MWGGICSAISGFWDKYIRPIVDFIRMVLIANLQFWMNVAQKLGEVWNAVCKGIGWAWDTLVKPVVDAVKWFCESVYNAFKWLFGWLIGGSLWTDLCKGIVGIWNSVVAPLIDTIRGFCDAVVNAFRWLEDTLGSIWNNICSAAQNAWNAVANAWKGIQDTVGGAAKAAGNAFSNFASQAGSALSQAGQAVWNFITSICFAHAIHNAVESSIKDLGKWVGAVKESMSKGVESVKSFVAEIGKPAALALGGVRVGAAAPVGAPPMPPPAPAPVTVTITAPLVNVEGSADRRTVELAVEKVKEALKTTLIEATSAAAPTKRIRVFGGVMF